MRVALLQTHANDDAEDNLQRTLQRMDEAAAAGADVACTKELFLHPYFPQEEDSANFDLAQSIPGPATEKLGAKAQEHGMVVVASLFEKRAKGVYHNTAAIFDADGTLRGTYRKMHIPDDSHFQEKYYFTPGDKGFPVFDTAAGRIAVLICWDQWYPEAARLAALQGADVILAPTAIGTWEGERDEAPRQHDSWQTVQRGHAIANNTYWCATNRVGKEGGLDFWGRSFAAGPTGEILAEAGDGEEVLTVDLDLEAIETVRRGWPFLRDRRTDAYNDLTRRVVDT